MAEIANIDGAIKIIDDAGNEVAIEASPFSPPMEMALADIENLLVNSWTVYSTTWSVSISKTNGVVTINGLVKGGLNNTAIMYLPLEYRPCIDVLSTQRTGNGSHRVDVYATGKVYAAGGDRVNATDWLSINFSFKASQP